jgi:ATP phosphoribosyltransferase
MIETNSFALKLFLHLQKDTKDKQESYRVLKNAGTVEQAPVMLVADAAIALW